MNRTFGAQPRSHRLAAQMGDGNGVGFGRFDDVDHPFVARTPRGAGQMGVVDGLVDVFGA